MSGERLTEARTARGLPLAGLPTFRFLELN